MGAGLRRSFQAAITVVMVAAALAGSTLLGTARATSRGDGSPSSQLTIKGAGFCFDRFAHTRFTFTVARTADGRLRGDLGAELGRDRRSFRGERLLSLSNSGDTATFTIAGALTGSESPDTDEYTADVTVTDGRPDSITISVHNEAVLYSAACTLTTGGITIRRRG